MASRLTGCFLILIITTAHAQQPPWQPQEPRQQEYLQLEQEIQKLANAYRRLEQSGDEALSAKRRDELANQLKELVNKAFDLRQEMRREDVKRLRARLEQVEATVSQREQAKDEIVEHRVASLLDADRNPAAPVVSGSFTQFFPQPPAGPTTPVPPRLSQTPPHASGGYLPGSTRVPPFPGPNAMPDRPTTGLPGSQSSGEHLALLNAEARNLESLHAAAERCREAAEAADRPQWEKCLAAFRTVEHRFQTYLEFADFEVQAAEAKLQESATRVARLKRLFESGVMSTGEYEEAQSELKLREIDVKRARLAKKFFEQLLAEANKIVDQSTTKVPDRSR